MKGFIKGRFIYIKCPKNGCLTYSNLLERNGWEQIDLFDSNIRYSDYLLWGHLTEPNTRHTKGVSQYLIMNPDIDLSNPGINEMLVSGVFDEHTYSLNMMLGSLFSLPIYWIPLDATIRNFNHPGSRDQLVICDGDALTNNFFMEHDIDIKVTLSDRRNEATKEERQIRDRINEWKQVYNNNYQKLVKNFLEPDILEYNETLKKFRLKYGSYE